MLALLTTCKWDLHYIDRQIKRGLAFLRLLQQEGKTRAADFVPHTGLGVYPSWIPARAGPASDPRPLG